MLRYASCQLVSQRLDLTGFYSQWTKPALSIVDRLSTPTLHPLSLQLCRVLTLNVVVSVPLKESRNAKEMSTVLLNLCPFLS